MDALRILSRSTKQSKHSISQQQRNTVTPSSGRNAQPQLFPRKDRESDGEVAGSRKRKRGAVELDTLDFFGGSGEKRAQKAKPVAVQNGDPDLALNGDDDTADIYENPARVIAPRQTLSLDDRKRVLRDHKVKVAWLNPPTAQKRDRRKGLDRKKSKEAKVEKESVFPEPLESFADLRSRYGISGRLAANVDDQGYSTPTEVQLGTLPLLAGDNRGIFQEDDSASVDLLTVAPTGSGKTLAFMIPLLHRITQSRRDTDSTQRSPAAVILAPTKELASQIVNEGRKLSQGTGVKVTQLRKGMKLIANKNSEEAETSVGASSEYSSERIVKSDVLVSTPGTLASILGDIPTRGSGGSAPLSEVCHFVLDEADVLLDPLFREQTLAIWNSLPHPHLQVSLWSATMGSNIEELAKSTIVDRRARITQDVGTAPTNRPLVRVVVGLKDSAVPNVQHRLIYAASEQGKLMGLRQLLHPATSSTDSGPPLLPPFLVFTQTIERAVALHSELLYDIPAEAGGIGRIAVLHSDLSDTARDSVMSKFRKGEIWVLITTDLLSRGVDFRGVNGVVNYDIPTSSAAYVHRVGRTGRAGREGGVAVTLYSKEDIPYLKPIANLIATAHKLKDPSGSSSAEGVQPWLLDALPSLSKKAKQDLKKRGVEARTARGAKNDPKAARKARISTKAGFVRREENKRKGAILGSQKRQLDDAGDETEFGGFD